MRKLIVSTYATLDGRVDEIQDWALPYDDASAARYHDDLLANSDGLLLGRKTYEVFATIWPPRSGKLPYVDKINSMPKYVASTTLRDLPWENSRLIEGDVAEGVATLKQQDALAGLGEPPRHGATAWPRADNDNVIMFIVHDQFCLP